eukprot:3941568-Rhodomonas_salina.1
MGVSAGVSVGYRRGYRRGSVGGIGGVRGGTRGRVGHTLADVLRYRHTGHLVAAYCSSVLQELVGAS